MAPRRAAKRGALILKAPSTPTLIPQLDPYRLFISSPGDVCREREAIRPSDGSADLFQSHAYALLSEGKSGFGFSRITFCLPALPELAGPESSDPHTSLAAKLRAQPHTP